MPNVYTETDFQVVQLAHIEILCYVKYLAGISLYLHEENYCSWWWCSHFYTAINTTIPKLFWLQWFWHCIYSLSVLTTSLVLQLKSEIDSKNYKLMFLNCTISLLKVGNFLTSKSSLSLWFLKVWCTWTKSEPITADFWSVMKIGYQW